MANQINFRVSNEEYESLRMLSEITGKSIPSLVKDAAMNNLRRHYIETALKMYEEGKIGLKAAWKLSGLSFVEFIEKLMENDIEPKIPEKLDDKMIALAESLREEDLYPSKNMRN